jgi:hypothetical protein
LAWQLSVTPLVEGKEREGKDTKPVVLHFSQLSYLSKQPFFPHARIFFVRSDTPESATFFAQIWKYYLVA